MIDADYLSSLRARLEAARQVADEADAMAVKAVMAEQPLIALTHYEQAHARYRVATKIAEGVLMDWPGASQ